MKQLLKHYLSANSSFAQYATIAQLYSSNSNNTSATIKASLYQLLWQPLEPYLHGIQTVYYAPTGLLHRIAFEALPLDASHRLIDKYELHQVLSTRSVALPVATARKPFSVALWGNINYNTHFYKSLEPSGGTQVSSFNFYTADTRGIRGKEWGSTAWCQKENWIA